MTYYNGISKDKGLGRVPCLGAKDGNTLRLVCVCVCVCLDFAGSLDSLH